MKKYIFGFLTAMICWNPAFSQTQNGFKYQAVLRDTEGNVIVNTQVNLRLSILSGSTVGTAVYSETHLTTTNQFGQINLEIGNGEVVAGNFLGISWADTRYYLKIEMDKTGGSGFEFLGTSTLLSVPFALHAQTVANNNDADADPKNEIQDLQLTGSTLSITNNPEATPIDLSVMISSDTDQQDLTLTGNELVLTNDTTPVDLIKYLDNTDNQKLAIGNDSLLIENGNAVALSDILASDKDPDSTNELQELSLSGKDLSITNGNTVSLSTLEDADADPQNEIQDLQLAGSTLKITNNPSATEINLAPFSGTNTDEQDLSLVGKELHLTNDPTSVDLSLLYNDTDSTNEIQSLNFLTDTLYLSKSNKVYIPTNDIDDLDKDPTNELQELSLSGTDLTISDRNTVSLSTLHDADADPQNEIQDLQLTGSTLTITGNANATEINLAAFTGTNTDEQDLSLVGTELHLTNDPTSVDLSSILTDVDSTNELQVLNYSNDTLYLSKGNKLYIPTSGGNGIPLQMTFIIMPEM